jgi:hypothetical protein
MGKVQQLNDFVLRSGGKWGTVARELVIGPGK